MKQFHFCDKPPTAVCGENLDRDGDGSFTLFYSATTNAFKNITCHTCQAWMYEHRLRPGGFERPVEWSR